jgi:hypothetical protein
LQHLPNATVSEYVATFRRRFRFLLITNDDKPDDLLNCEIQAGGWRPILLDRPPFSQIAPIVFSRTDTVGGWRHKATCLIEGDRQGEYVPPVSAVTNADHGQAEPRAGASDTRVVDLVQPTAHDISVGKRFIRLKEFPPSTDLSNTPHQSYVAIRDSSLIRQAYSLKTDPNGFILSSSGGRTTERTLVVMGDSVVESMFTLPEHRFCSRLEDMLFDDLGLSVAVLNGGYSGATSLHSFNTFLNKVIPLRPAAVLLMTGIVDADVACLKASFWSRDRYVDPIVDTAAAANGQRDNEKLASHSFDDRRKLLTMLAKASELFDIPLWYATVPHLQVFGGEYVEKAHMDEVEFARQVDFRRRMNEVTRSVANDLGIRLFDLER